MPRVLISDYSIAWLVLLALTVLSLWFGFEADQSQSGNHTVAALMLGFFKVAIVGAVFMGLARAPLLLKALFYGWCCLMALVLSGIYFWG